MGTLNLDNTNIKFWDTVKLVGLALTIAGGIWRFETQMANLQNNQEALRKEIMYTYSVEIIKLNGRIDLLESKMNVSNIARLVDTTDVNKLTINELQHTNKAPKKEKRLPQVCMILSRQPEIKKRTYFDIEHI